MSEDSIEVGQRTRALQGFEHNANKQQEFLKKTKNLEPPPLSLKQKLTRWFGGAAAVGALSGAAAVSVDRIQNASSWYGDPVDPNETTLHAKLTPSLDEDGKPMAIQFQDNPTTHTNSYSPEQLKEMGVDPNSADFEVKYVLGDAYASNLADAQMLPGDKTQIGDKEIVNTSDHEFGIWGQIVVDGKPTGIFVERANIQELPPVSQSQPD